MPGVVSLEPAFIRAEIASPGNQLAGPHFTGNLAYSFAGIDTSVRVSQTHPSTDRTSWFLEGRTVGEPSENREVW